MSHNETPRFIFVLKEIKYQQRIAPWCMQASKTDVNKSSLLKVGRDAHKEAGRFVAQMKWKSGSEFMNKWKRL